MPFGSPGRKWDYDTETSTEKTVQLTQAVSHQLPTTVVRIRARVNSLCDLLWTKWHWGRFSPSMSVAPANRSTDCPTLIIIHHPGAGTIGLIVAYVHRALSPTPHQEMKKNLYNVGVGVDEFVRSACSK
jgi:hypothetical protein